MRREAAAFVSRRKKQRSQCESDGLPPRDTAIYARLTKQNRRVHVPQIFDRPIGACRPVGVHQHRRKQHDLCSMVRTESGSQFQRREPRRCSRRLLITWTGQGSSRNFAAAYVFQGVDKPVPLTEAAQSQRLRFAVASRRRLGRIGFCRAEATMISEAITSVGLDRDSNPRHRRPPGPRCASTPPAWRVRATTRSCA